MRRREFISLIGGVAATWPLAVGAQQPAMPVVAFVRDGSPEANARYVAAFRKGLNEFRLRRRPERHSRVSLGWRASTIVCRTLLADLVRRQVAVIATPGSVASVAAALQLQRSRSSSPSARTRSTLVLLPVSPGPVATQRAPIFSSRKLWPSGCGSCMNSCPRLFVLPFWSTRTINQRTPHCEARRKPLRPSGANPDPQCQFDRRDRRGLCHTRARAPRCPLRRRRRILLAAPYNLRP